jgi:protein SCO1/2
MAGWPFPVLALGMLISFTALTAAMLVIPSGETGFKAFADEFRIWCFGYNPATGKMEPAYVVLMFINPMMLAGLIAMVWSREIRGGLRQQRRAVLSVAGAGGVAIVAATSGLLLFDIDKTPTEMPFPAEELRTSYAVPEFALVDHNGSPVADDTFAGDVLMITSIYSCCPDACPLILQQAQRVVASIDPELRRDLHVYGITMDPERDTPESLAGMARVHGVDPAVFHLLSGTAAAVNPVLDRLGFERRVDPETGLIDHASLFLLVDRQGRIAYRLTVGDTQEEWLATALNMLLREPAPITGEQARR